MGPGRTGASVARGAHRAGGAARVLGLVVLAALVAGCGRSISELLPGEQGDHDRRVARLERRVEAEEGWIVVPVPNLHEGGGTTTWWLHPCDPETDEQREVTRTAYHGSDVMGLSGLYEVEEATGPCAPPRRTVELDHGRRVQLDADVVDLGGFLGLLEERERVTVEDPDHGAREVIELMAGQPTRGPCDGRVAWTARLDSRRDLSLGLGSCMDTVAALPETARELLAAPLDLDAGHASLAEDDVEAFEAALTTAGWEADTIRVQTFEGSYHAPYWFGPCGPGLDRPGRDDGDRTTRPEADWIDGTVELRERPCP